MSTVNSQFADRIKLAPSFDAAEMAKEIRNLDLSNFTYYDVVPLKAPSHELDRSLPIPPPADDYADGSWTEWSHNSILEKLPTVKALISYFEEHAKVNLVRLLRLEAGATVREHCDPTLGIEIERSVIRLTIPIITNPEVKFYLNDLLVPMQVGECWYLRLTDKHRIDNHSSEERINLTIDMIPNEWVHQQLIEGC